MKFETIIGTLVLAVKTSIVSKLLTVQFLGNSIFNNSFFFRRNELNCFLPVYFGRFAICFVDVLVFVLFVIRGYYFKKADIVVFSCFNSLNCNSEFVLLCFFTSSTENLFRFTSFSYFDILHFDILNFFDIRTFSDFSILASLVSFCSKCF